MTHLPPPITKRFSRLHRKTRQQRQSIFGLILLGCLHGCASVTITPSTPASQADAHQQSQHATLTETPDSAKRQPKTDLGTPDFVQSVPFTWFGLAGTHRFDVKEICAGNNAVKIKTLHTFKDLLTGLRTVFFRLPKTAKIWCEQPPSKRTDLK